MAHSHEQSPDRAAAPPSNHDEFEQLVADLSGANNADEQGRIKQKIWSRFGTSGATTRISQRKTLVIFVIDGNSWPHACATNFIRCDQYV